MEERTGGGDFVTVLVYLFQGKQVLWPLMVPEVTTQHLNFGLNTSRSPYL